MLDLSAHSIDFVGLGPMALAQRVKAVARVNLLPRGRLALADLGNWCKKPSTCPPVAAKTPPASFARRCGRHIAGPSRFPLPIHWPRRLRQQPAPERTRHGRSSDTRLLEESTPRAFSSKRQRRWSPAVAGHGTWHQGGSMPGGRQRMNGLLAAPATRFLLPPRTKERPVLPSSRVGLPLAVLTPPPRYVSRFLGSTP